MGGTFSPGDVAHGRQAGRQGDHDPSRSAGAGLGFACRGLRDRVSPDGQGRGGRRRPGDADRRGPRESWRRGGKRPTGGRGGFRRLEGVPGAAGGRATPHRGADHCGHPRAHRSALRAGVLHPAPPSEDHGRSALSVRGRGPSQTAFGGGGGRFAGGGLRGGGHGGVHRGGRPELLVPGDEHAPASRASGDRGDHRTGPGAPPDRGGPGGRSSRGLWREFPWTVTP